jgi:hypothetical protein
LLEELTPRQLNVLMAYAAIEPFGEERADLRSACHTARLMESLGAKGVDPADLARYLQIHQDDEKAAATPDRSAAFVTSIFRR